MKRRKFLKNVGMGTAASMVLPKFSKADNSVNKIDSNSIRSKDDEYIEKFNISNAVRSGIATGGIGTGSIELRKDGKFYNWTIFNNKPKGTGPRLVQKSNANEDPEASNLFFIVRYQIEGENPKMKLLQITDGLNEGAMTGTTYYFPWMEMIENIEYKARFPFTNIKFTDSEMPFEINMETYSPFIPHDVKNSALPIANFDFKIKSNTAKKIDIMIIASLRNLVGYDTSKKYFKTEIIEEKDYLSCVMSCGGMDESQSSFGEMVLSSLNPKSTYYCGWEHRHPYYEFVIRNKKLPNIDDTDGTSNMNDIPIWLPHTGGRNKVDKETNEKNVSNRNDPRLFSSVAQSFVLNKKHSEVDHSFMLSWDFPNLYAEPHNKNDEPIIEGHYYSNYFKNGKDITDYAVKNKLELFSKSKEFLSNYFDSSLPTYVLEQVNSQLNTFVASGRLVKEGWFGVQEGMAPSQSWGPVATVDVALYGSVPIIALFPELQKSNLRAHKMVQKPNGQIAHGLYKNFKKFEDSTAGVSDRVDLPSQYIIMVLRDYFWTNDLKYLNEMWPSIVKAMDYVLNHLDINNDLMPEMEGARSSYDNFPMFGLASYIQSQWICAMASVNLAAKDAGDKKIEILSKKILTKAKEMMDDHLWNGTYYRLYNDYSSVMEIDKKIDDGCLTDQIIGQWAAHSSGLGYILDKKNVKKSLNTILEMSYKKNKYLKNVSWPGDGYLSEIPRNMWVDQGNTYWNGVELEFASFLIYEGMYKEGIELTKAIDDRYRKCGLYWDHQEFGGHYFRSMSAWAIVNAAVGLQINRASIYFSPKLDEENYKLFFATPTGTSHFIKYGDRISIKQLSGNLSFQKLILSNIPFLEKLSSINVNGNDIKYDYIKVEEGIKLKFKKKVNLKTNELIYFIG